VALSSDSKHVETLRRGPRSWNQWRAQNPSLTPNLTGIALSVAERQMGPISGGPINFSFTRLRQASLRFATLTGASFEMADLSEADLSDARLEGANLSGADLGEALLERANFAGARLGGANLSGANLTGARNLTQTQIDEALGDALTVLPPHLTRPAGWGGAVSQVVSGPQPRNGTHTGSGNGATPASRNDSVTWLVGGPRRSGAHASTRLAAPEKR
jgi:Pentapeptide repeats (8 copies)